MIILLVLTFVLIALFEVPGLIHRKYWRELVVFGILLVIGFVMNLLIMIGKPWPPHGTAITNLYKAIFPGFFELIKL